MTLLEFVPLTLNALDYGWCSDLIECCRWLPRPLLLRDPAEAPRPWLRRPALHFPDTSQRTTPGIAPARSAAAAKGTAPASASSRLTDREAADSRACVAPLLLPGEQRVERAPARDVSSSKSPPRFPDFFRDRFPQPILPLPLLPKPLPYPTPTTSDVWTQSDSARLGGSPTVDFQDQPSARLCRIA
jgi:hypothetical protein